MKAFRYLYLSVCAVADLALFFFGLSGIALFWNDPDPSVPIGVVFSVAGCAVVLLGITIAGFYKTAKNKPWPVLFGFLLKFPVLFLFLGFAWLAMGIPEACLVAAVISIPLGALILYLPKMLETSRKNQYHENPIRIPQFTKDKAELAWDAAAEEYRRLQGQPEQELTDSENDKIYDYAGAPIAYFLGWLIKSNYVSSTFLLACDSNALQDVRDEKMTPLEYLARMDYVLSRDDIDPGILRFVDLYYRTDPGDIPLTHNTPRYFFDYYKIVCADFDSPRYYCVDFRWDRFHKLSEVLDRRLKEFNSQGYDVDRMEKRTDALRSPYFSTEAALYVEPGTPSEYAEKCADAFVNMSGALRKEISAQLVEYCAEGLSEELAPEEVIRYFEPSKVLVFRPSTSVSAGDIAGNIPAFMVLGECEREREHGISFTVIGNHAVDFGYYGDTMPPTDEDLQWKYRILEDAAQNNLCEAEVIPARFGGKSGSADNEVLVPVAAAERKQEYEDLIEALYMLKMADHYTCKITYKEEKPGGLFITATKDSRRTFSDSIPLG